MAETSETRFWWVRHAPTHQKVVTGWRDVAADLSDSAHLERLSKFLPKNALIVSSDLVRAKQTADAIQLDRKRLADSSELREINFGDWDGRHFSDVAESDPELSRAFWENPGEVEPPNGESWNMAEERARSFVDRALIKHSGRDIILVAHFGIILTQLSSALAIPPAEVLAQKIDPLSVTQLVHRSGHWRAMLINHQV